MKRRIKGFIGLLLGLTTVFVCLFSTSCGKNDESGSEGKVMHVAVYNTTTEKNAINAIIAAFKQKYPDYLAEQGIDDIEAKPMNESTYATTIQSKARTGTLPDVYLSLDMLAPVFASNEVSLNLTPYVEANEEYKALVGDMYESMYAQGVFDNELHLVAREYARNVIYYNKAILRECGLSEPSNDWTWDDFCTYAKAMVKTENGVVVRNGADLSLNWPTNVFPIIIGLGDEIFDGNGEAAVGEKTAAAYAKLKELVDAGAVVNTFSATGTSFSNKTVGMAAGTRATIANMLQYFTGEEKESWGVVCFPDTRAYNGGKSYIGAGTSGYSVSAKSRFKDAAVKFVMFMLSEEGQTAFASTGNFVPVKKSLATNACWTTGLKIGLPSGFNHEAYTYNSEYDIRPFCNMIKDPSKQNAVITQINLMTEYYLSYGVNYKDYTTADGWATYWNNEINNCFR